MKIIEVSSLFTEIAVEDCSTVCGGVATGEPVYSSTLVALPSITPVATTTQQRTSFTEEDIQEIINKAQQSANIINGNVA